MTNADARSSADHSCPSPVSAIHWHPQDLELETGSRPRTCRITGARTPSKERAAAQQSRSRSTQRHCTVACPMESERMQHIDNTSRRDTALTSIDNSETAAHDRERIGRSREPIPPHQSRTQHICAHQTPMTCCERTRETKGRFLSHHAPVEKAQDMA